MMMTGRAFSTATKSTPAGLLTEAEVWCKISDLAARIKETGEKTSVLFSALRGGLVGSVFSLMLVIRITETDGVPCGENVELLQTRTQ